MLPSKVSLDMVIRASKRKITGKDHSIQSDGHAGEDPEKKIYIPNSPKNSQLISVVTLGNNLGVF